MLGFFMWKICRNVEMIGDDWRLRLEMIGDIQLDVEG